MTQGWHVHGERTLYRDGWIHLVMADVALPGGQRLGHRLIRYFDGAHAVVVDAGRILLLWRQRFIPGTWGWEIPGGAVNAGEHPAAAAAREVEEETGWRPEGPMRPIFRVQPMPGLVNVTHHAFRADSAVYTGPPSDNSEAQRIVWVPFAEVRRLIARGDILEATTLAALLAVLGRDDAGQHPRTHGEPDQVRKESDVMTSPVLGSILLGTRDPGRMRAWYQAAFGARDSGDDFLDLGGVHVLMDHRDDVAGTSPEPGRFILNFHVSDARATAAHLDGLGVRWLAEVEERPDGLFGTLVDPDGNYVQIIELSAEYLARQAQRTS